MKKKWMMIKNEDGSLSIEFLGLLPFFFILFLVFWQIIGSGVSLLLAQNAVNEAAKVYSITGSKEEAKQALNAVIGSNSILESSLFEITNDGDGYFTVKMSGQHKIVFGPDSWRRIFTIPHHTFGRMIE